MRAASRILPIVVGAAALFACGEVSTGTPDAPETPTATLIVTTSGGAGTVTSTPAGINCGADCSEAYAIGTAVIMTATPGASATFVGWSGGGCSGTGTCAVAINADTAVTATFAMSNSLTVVRAGTGTGTVTSSPAGINCGADCDEIYTGGTVVTLTAVGDVSSTFAGWSGGGCSGTSTCIVTVSAATTVTATFTLNRYALTATRSGNGSGSIDSAPAGIQCGADCTEDYDHGAMVTLTGNPAVGSTFAGWSGGGCSGTGTCVVTMLAATSVTGTFMLDTSGVTVMRAGNGTGTVTSSPAGINCGADCSENYTFGTMVTLTATPAVGSTFTGWSGGGCSGTGSCVVTVTAATAVTATFTLTQHTLTVTRAGTGSGTVTSTPAGINCGADCTETVNYGTVLTLAAAPAVGSTFTGWSGGGCSGTGACVVGVTAAVTVTATFTLNSYTLSVTRAGNGTGTVTSVPSGISCGADCAEVYNHGTVVTLTATVTGSNTFTGWTGGGCSGTGTCVVTMAAATAVTATFTTVCATGSQTFNYTGALQTFTVPSCVTSLTVDARGASGGNGGIGGIGGRGARMVGTVTVAGGEAITILVGGAGLNGTNDNEQGGGSGGGGTFVVRSGSPLVVAGGGGGGMGHSGTYIGDGIPGQITTDGSSGGAMGGAGGVMGGGGTTWPWPGWHSGTGGGGFTGDGINDSNGNTASFGTVNTPGRAFVNGGGGGGGGVGGSAPGRNGGYGGGGASGFSGGGGGGYSGGGSGYLDGNPNGGGGGSINSGSNQTNTIGFQAGNGQVILSW